MKPVTQTKLGRYGNCWLACIASVLEVPLESVPDVTHLYEPNERGDDGVPSARITIERWLMREHGLFLYHFHAGQVPLVRPLGYHLIGGESPRGNPHSVVGLDGAVVHDPHPEGGGLRTVDQYETFGVATADTAEYYGERLPDRPHPIVATLRDRCLQLGVSP